MVGREATGGAMPTPDDQVREDELVVVSYIRALLDSGIRPRSVERYLRVLGDGMRRLATTQGDAWRTDLMEPMLASGAAVQDVEDKAVAEGRWSWNKRRTAFIIAVCTRIRRGVGRQHHRRFRIASDRCRPADSS